MAKIFLALAFVSIAQTLAVEAEEAKDKIQAQLENEQGAEAQAMKAQLEAQLKQYLVAEQEKEAADRTNREQRWSAILHKQQQSLIQHEQSIKTEAKELEKMQREKQWQKAAATKTAESSDACAGQKSTVSAFISSSESHASCLKSQLGACIATEVTAATSLHCDEPSAGWQKKCLSEKAQEMADCAPLGVDWNAMRQGEEGEAAPERLYLELPDFGAESHRC